MTRRDFFLVGVFPLLALICTISLLSPSVTVAQDDLLVRALELREQYRETEALQLFEQILEKDSENYQALLNAGFLHFRRGWLYSEQGSEEQKRHFLQLAAYAERAQRLQPAAYQAILLLVVAKAKTSPYLTPGDQVRVAGELHRDLPILIASAPDDPTPIYILSWLNMKVGEVGSLERFLASMFYGGLSEDLTTEKAVRLMEKAIAMRPDYSVYHYDLGLFRQRLGRLEEARALFGKVIEMTPKTPEDEVYGKWARLRLMELAQDEPR